MTAENKKKMNKIGPVVLLSLTTIIAGGLVAEFALTTPGSYFPDKPQFLPDARPISTNSQNVSLFLYWQRQVNHRLTESEWIEIQHVGATNRFTEYEINRAMDTHYERNPLCALCRRPYSVTKAPSGRNKRNEVHHCRPQRSAPWLAAWLGDDCFLCNLITFDRSCHGFLGHGIFNGGSWSHENFRLRETVHAMRAAYTNEGRWLKR